MEEFDYAWGEVEKGLRDSFRQGRQNKRDRNTAASRAENQRFLDTLPERVSSPPRGPTGGPPSIASRTPSVLSAPPAPEITGGRPEGNIPSNFGAETASDLTARNEHGYINQDGTQNWPGQSPEEAPPLPLGDVPDAAPPIESTGIGQGGFEGDRLSEEQNDMNRGMETWGRGLEQAVNESGTVTPEEADTEMERFEAEMRDKLPPINTPTPTLAEALPKLSPIDAEIKETTEAIDNSDGVNNNPDLNVIDQFAGKGSADEPTEHWNANPDAAKNKEALDAGMRAMQPEPPAPAPEPPAPEPPAPEPPEIETPASQEPQIKETVQEPKEESESTKELRRIMGMTPEEARTDKLYEDIAPNAPRPNKKAETKPEPMRLKDPEAYEAKLSEMGRRSAGGDRVGSTPKTAQDELMSEPKAKPKAKPKPKPKPKKTETKIKRDKKVSEAAKAKTEDKNPTKDLPKAPKKAKETAANINPKNKTGIYDSSEGEDPKAMRVQVGDKFMSQMAASSAVRAGTHKWGSKRDGRASLIPVKGAKTKEATHKPDKKVSEVAPKKLKKEPVKNKKATTDEETPKAKKDVKGVMGGDQPNNPKKKDKEPKKN